jgi:formylglycine-generating enzyme
MVWVPAGEFTMGSPEHERRADEHPLHVVMLPALWMDRTEVTNGQYGRFLEYIERTGDHGRCFEAKPASKDHTPPYWTEPKWNGPKQPVVAADGYYAYAYAAWAGKRLPAEAEWERAARGADDRRCPGATSGTETSATAT